MTQQTLAACHDALLLDLDGTVWSGERPIPHAVESITASGLPAVYITNNASRGPDEVAARLSAIGLATGPADVLTSAQAAITLAASHANPGDPVLVVGAPSFRELAADAGYTVTRTADDNPKVVLHGHSPDTGWRDLTEAAIAIQRGAAYVASNVDTTLPTERGLAVGNGSMVAAVTSATGVVPESAGKPGPAMFRQAAAKVGARRPLAVGDRLNTDIAGAVASGAASLHVLTGVSGPQALVAASPEERPTYIAADMRGLAADPAVLLPGPQGGFTARYDGVQVVLSGGMDDATSGAADGEEGLQALRTVLDVVWSREAPVQKVVPGSPAAEAALAQWW